MGLKSLAIKQLMFKCLREALNAFNMLRRKEILWGPLLIAGADKIALCGSGSVLVCFGNTR